MASKSSTNGKVTRTKRSSQKSERSRKGNYASARGRETCLIIKSDSKIQRALAESGADAVSVDQLNDLAASRAVLKDVMLFGNLDPVQTLFRGDEAKVAEAVSKAKEAGVEAVWPGCDLVPQTRVENIKAMINAG